MKCPKCKKTVSENDAVCSNCGVALKDKKHNTFKNLFIKNKKQDRPMVLETMVEASNSQKSHKNKKREKKIKITILTVVALLVAALIIVLISQLTSDKGEKKASQTAEFIGETITDAEKDLKIHFKDNSQFHILNKAVAFDYVYETDDKVEIDDVSYPEWTIAILNDSNANIEKVTYTNYKVLKKDSRGKKLSKKINLDSFDKGARFSSVTDQLKLDPYKIIYAENSTSYIYKYHYTQSNSDDQNVLLTIVFDEKMKYLYYTSVDLYPLYM